MSLLVERINALLPQTQCTRCGFPACRPYAEAIALGEADIDRCPPGGSDGVTAIATLLNLPTKALDPNYGIESAPTIAVIDEDVCIGCTKCIQACPVDAIIGAAKRMHTVITAECTGCELCIPPCPVDCISMTPIASEPLARDAVLTRAAHARSRYETRQRRLQQKAEADTLRVKAENTATKEAAAQAPITRNAVLEAIARGKARRAAGSGGSSSA
jgi:electron transport complex protein RnfB